MQCEKGLVCTETHIFSPPQVSPPLSLSQGRGPDAEIAPDALCAPFQVDLFALRLFF